MRINLLDLNTDILNIIGDYVKKDNNEKIKQFNIKNYVTCNRRINVGFKRR